MRGYNKKGLSEVVTTLLFVLLALGAVLMVWFLVRGLISGGVGAVNVQKSCLDLELEVTSCTLSATDATVSVKRGNQETAEGVTLDGVNFVFEQTDGTAESVKKLFTINALETKSQSALFTDIGGTPIKVGVSGLITLNGAQSSCPESVRVNCV